MMNKRLVTAMIALMLSVLAVTDAVSQEHRTFEQMIDAAEALFNEAKGTLLTAVAAYEARLVAEAAKEEDDTPPEAGIAPSDPSVVIAPPSALPDTSAAADISSEPPVVPVAPIDTAASVATVVADTVATASAVDTVTAPVATAPTPVTPPPPPPPKTYPIGKPDIEMVFVKGGKFKMGCVGDEPGCIGDERPVHEVSIKNFLIGKYPVTQKQWKSVMGLNPAHFQKGDNNDDHPVEQVSWNEVQEFIRRLNAMTGKKYRLPTEAEWEYAARGGAKAKAEKFWGNRFLDDIAWHEYNSKGTTQPVGKKKPNYLGIHDMLGNTWEWTADWYNGFYYRQSPVKNPQGPRTGDARVYRGCSFTSQEQYCRISLRNSNRPDHRAIDVGFRLAQTP